MADIKTCVGENHYLPHDWDRKTKYARIPCSKAAEYKVFPREFTSESEAEFYCCSDHVQFYRDSNKRDTVEFFTITKL